MENSKDPTIPNTNEINEDLYKQIRDHVIEQSNSSTTWIQRKFDLEYNVAGFYVHLLEERGIIGPPIGSKNREVFVKPGDPIPEYPPKQNQKPAVSPVTETPTQVESPESQEFTEEEYKNVGEYVIEHGSSDADDLASKLGVERENVALILSYLSDKGFIKAVKEHPNSGGLVVVAERHTPLPEFPFARKTTPPVGNPSSGNESVDLTTSTPEIPPQSKERVLSPEHIKNMYEFTVLTAMAKMLNEEIKNVKDKSEGVSLRNRMAALVLEMGALEQKIEDAKITKADYKDPENMKAMKAFALKDAIECNRRVLENKDTYKIIWERQTLLDDERRESDIPWDPQPAPRADRGQPTHPSWVSGEHPSVPTQIENTTKNAGGLNRVSGLNPVKFTQDGSQTPENKEKETKNDGALIRPESYKNTDVQKGVKNSLEKIASLKKQIERIETMKDLDWSRKLELRQKKFIISCLEGVVAKTYYDTVEAAGSFKSFPGFFQQKDPNWNTCGDISNLYMWDGLSGYFGSLLDKNGEDKENKFAIFLDVLNRYSATLKQ